MLAALIPHRHDHADRAWRVPRHLKNGRGHVAHFQRHAVGGVDVALHLRKRRGRRRRGWRRRRGIRGCPSAPPTAATTAGALQIDLPVVAMHDGLRAGHPLNVLAAAGVIEVVVPEHQVLDLHRVELQLLHLGQDDVARVFLAVHGVEHDVSVVRRDQPRTDPGVADPVEVVEEPLPPDDNRRARRRVGLQFGLAVGHADRRAVAVLRAA